MVDSHCHLADETFAGDLDDVVRRAKDAGVDRVLIVLAAGDAAEAGQAGRIATLWPEAWFSIGVHPHSAGEFAGEAARAVSLVRTQYESTPGARAIGEIGLDYHYDFSPRDVQREIFRAQLRLAMALERPVVIHTREADADSIDILKDESGGKLRGVLHCFTGDASLARAGLDLGLHISLAGIVTFPRAASLRETARLVPLDRLLVETDSPFLAPVPYRGKRNEPAHVAQVIAALADVHGVPVQHMVEATSANFRALFGP